VPACEKEEKEPPFLKGKEANLQRKEMEKKKPFTHPKIVAKKKREEERSWRLPEGTGAYLHSREKKLKNPRI